MLTIRIRDGALHQARTPPRQWRSYDAIGQHSPTLNPHNVEANELPLRLRSQKLALQYILKLKSNPGNPAYSSVLQPNYRAVFDAQPNIVPTLGLRLRQALSESGVNLNCIAQRLIHSTPPWLFRTPGFCYTLYYMGTKSNTSPDLYLSRYMKLVSEDYEGYDKIFTDSLKQGICVAAAAVSHDKVLVKRLSNHASIFSAKAIAFLLALDIISQSTKQHFLILLDSLSCVNVVENRNLENPLVV
jgi:hypothetical protein